MNSNLNIDFEFTKYIPDELSELTVYISIPFATATHLCPCGCGSRVVTPLSPVDWALTFDGDTVSLHPSLGNWSLPCESHYWIRRNQIIWAPRWTQDEIEHGRMKDRMIRRSYDDDYVTSTSERMESHAGLLTGWLRSLRERVRR